MFDMYHGQFNATGEYFLKLAVSCTDPDADLSQIVVQKNKGGYENVRAVETDTITQAELKRSYKFKDNRFTFFLPKGKSHL